MLLSFSEQMNEPGRVDVGRVDVTSCETVSGVTSDTLLVTNDTLLITGSTTSSARSSRLRSTWLQ